MSGPRYPGFTTLALHTATSPQAAPTAVATLEERIAALEGGVAGLATASSQAALHLALATLAGAGDHVVAAHNLRGEHAALLAHGLARFGVATTFVDPRDPHAWRSAIRPETRLLAGAALGHADLDVLDIPQVAAIAHEHDLPLLVDASLATPWLLMPFDHGADLVIHDAAFLSGKAGATGGLLVDGGTFDWHAAHARTGRFAGLCEPDPGCDGRVFAEESTVGAFALRARHAGLRDFGATPGAYDAAVMLNGLETLGVRMERHVAGARRVAEALAAHPAVASVAYPDLDSHPDHAIARRLLPRGCGAIVPFALLGGPAAAARFLDGLKLVGREGASGGARSHAASAAAGTVRLAIGLEDADDLLDDIARALKLAQKGA
ncbi:PLP-dependent transferase [Massilia putida]|uniref:PLP-dependent transferase n=1 Tax=Massilia putida TaxID=1141883 RepID=UPI000950C759|nr:PLP-dependent transferase [Massilia putida]